MTDIHAIQAVIFDFDGVIADTEPLHHRAFQEVLEPEGLGWSWEEYTQFFMGFDDRDAFRAAYLRSDRELTDARLAELVDAKAVAFIRHASEEVELYPGIIELLHSIQGRWPLGLCSGALRSDIDPILKRFDLASVFDVMVTAEDVAASKPDPACYRKALNLLEQHHNRGLDPARCVAIEDTPAGIQAALGADLQVWAVTHTHDAEQINHAHLVLNSVESLIMQFAK